MKGQKEHVKRKKLGMKITFIAIDTYPRIIGVTSSASQRTMLVICNLATSPWSGIAPAGHPGLII